MSEEADLGCVLLWGPRADRVRAWTRALVAHDLRAVVTGASLEADLEQARPAAAIVDAGESPNEALEICAALREHQGFALPILVVLAPGDTRTLKRGRELAVSEFAEHPSTPDVLALRIREHVRTSEAGGETASGTPDPPSRDGLTGLASRPSFLESMAESIERAEAAGCFAALLYLDIDRFKAVNDALGHSVGDVLLQHVARILEGQVRASDMVRNGPALDNGVSRLGGDEFTVLLSGLGRPEDAGEVARRILSAIKAPVLADGYQLATTASIGIAVFPQDARDPESLLRCADMAMYAAKAQGRGRWLFYRPSMGALRHRRLEVEQKLRYAIDRGELEVRYQPRLDLENDVISGVEALARWHSRDLGEVPPKEFIPIAEESGLILQIGEWVLETACRQLRQWHREGLTGMRVSVNVSSRQFSSGDLMRTVSDVLRRTQVDPHALELEVTESLMLAADEITALALRDLRGIGVTIALDDFGTGYSSLASITRFPLDVLKIDRSIASEVEGDPAAASIVSAVVTLAGSLGLGVVGEGVDAVGQARTLARLGCDEIQGFLLTPALPAAEVEKFCRDWPGLDADDSGLPFSAA